MTSRVHHSHAWTHESRARSLPASGAYSHELSSARFPRAAWLELSQAYPELTLDVLRKLDDARKEAA